MSTDNASRADAADMPVHLMAEHAAGILKRAQYQKISETEALWARECLEAALAALPAVTAPDDRQLSMTPRWRA